MLISCNENFVVCFIGPENFHADCALCLENGHTWQPDIANACTHNCAVMDVACYQDLSFCGWYSVVRKGVCVYVFFVNIYLVCLYVPYVKVLVFFTTYKMYNMQIYYILSLHTTHTAHTTHTHNAHINTVHVQYTYILESKTLLEWHMTGGFCEILVYRLQNITR